MPSRKTPGGDWIEIELVDPRGEPRPGIAWRIVTADGAVHEGRTDVLGRAFVADVGSGACEVSFPDLDRHEWGPA